MRRSVDKILASRGLIEAVTRFLLFSFLFSFLFLFFSFSFSFSDTFGQHVGSSAQKVYCGFDPTTDSLHIGNLLGIVALLHFQAAGHSPIALVNPSLTCQVGGATGHIGDPSGRGTDRTPMKAEQITQNVDAIAAQIRRFEVLLHLQTETSS